MLGICTLCSCAKPCVIFILMLVFDEKYDFLELIVNKCVPLYLLLISIPNKKKILSFYQ